MELRLPQGNKLTGEALEQLPQLVKHLECASRLHLLPTFLLTAAASLQPAGTCREASVCTVAGCGMLQPADTATQSSALVLELPTLLSNF